MANNGATADDKTDGYTRDTAGVIEAAQDRAAEVTDRLRGAKDVAVDQARSMLGALRQTIAARPLVAVGLAFGLGYVAMRVLRR